MKAQTALGSLVTLCALTLSSPAHADDVCDTCDYSTSTSSNQNVAEKTCVRVKVVNKTDEDYYVQVESNPCNENNDKQGLVYGGAVYGTYDHSRTFYAPEGDLVRISEWRTSDAQTYLIGGITEGDEDLVIVLDYQSGLFDYDLDISTFRDNIRSSGTYNGVSGYVNPPSQVNDASTTGVMPGMVGLDCARSGIGSEATANNVTMTFYDGSFELYSTRLSYSEWCSYNSPYVLFAEHTVTKVVLETDGSDALFIDYLTLLGGTFPMLHNWGRNGGKGWCLSTDPTDADGGWSRYVNGDTGRKCGYKIEFEVGGGAEVFRR